jgi:hypothetical protein
MNDLLRAVRENPEFKQVMEDSLKMRPVIPAFSICKTKDEQDMVVENLKYFTAMRQGFDNLHQYLTGKNPNVSNVKEIKDGRAKADG